MEGSHKNHAGLKKGSRNSDLGQEVTYQKVGRMTLSDSRKRSYARGSDLYHRIGKRLL